MAPDDTSLEVYPNDPAQPASSPNTADDFHDEIDTESPAPNNVEVPPAGNMAVSRSWMRPTMFAIGSVLVIMLIASQVYLVTTLTRTQADLGPLETQVASVDVAVSKIADTVTAAPSSGAVIPGASPAPAIPSGSFHDSLTVRTIQRLVWHSPRSLARTPTQLNLSRSILPTAQSASG